MRLHKYIAHAGVASRRAAEQMIREGRVSVNGQVVSTMGMSVDPSRDSVECDGQRIRLPAGKHYFLLHKPRGVMSTLSDPEGRVTVRDYLPPRLGRLFPVGRLDWDTEGVLLFTDDGSLAHRLAHPRFGVERTYHVKVRGEVGADAIARIRRGLRLEDGPARPERVRPLRGRQASSWITLTLREGRYHEVKRIFAALGHPVQKLRRVSFAGLSLGRLRPGEGRLLTEEEVARLHRAGKK